jgi:BirA family biotin operon repressor/biotin-[acetyl-CoA-carboxylase] ligase
MDAESLHRASEAARLPHPIGYTAVTASTNDDLRALARAGAPSGTALVAGAQTAGRGRLGRRWEMAADGALALSVLVRPHTLTPQQLPLLALAAAVAVVDVAGPGYGIKWPNDVLDGQGRKVAGVLCELEQAYPPVAVIGIGVNVGAAPELPEVGWLNADGGERDRATVAAALTAAVLETVRLLCRNPDAVLDRWRARAHTLGRQVTVGAVTGEAVALDPDGALVVRQADGARVRVLAGDVRMVEDVSFDPGRKPGLNSR